MINGCGIDIVEIKRIRKMIDKWGIRFLKKIYTHKEIEACQSKKLNQYQSLAGIFAAKEAFVKSIGTGFRNIQWKDIEITHNKLGKPMINISEELQKKFQRGHNVYFHLSIAHTQEIAIAEVIAEGLNK